MCQINSQPSPQKEIIGYRVYDATKLPIVSYFFGLPLDHGIGEKKRAYSSEIPFYIIVGDDSLRKFIEVIQEWKKENPIKIVVYKVKLEENLQTGIWEDGEIKNLNIYTATGNVITLLEEIDVPN